MKKEFMDSSIEEDIKFKDFDLSVFLLAISITLGFGLFSYFMADKIPHTKKSPNSIIVELK